ncbi:MAG: thymidylate kinase [Clostridia bacterium]|nr:thymidylate kinase [Clostridia bacterium]
MKIIAFCGIDGAGKSTQLFKARDALNALGYSSYVSKVAYYPFHIFQEQLTQHDMRIGMAFQFAKHYLELIPELEKKGIDYLLCDRHALCHLAFAKTYGLDDEKIEHISKIFNLAKSPDLICYFDLPLSVAMDRIINRSEKAVDSDETVEILGATQNNYKDIIAKFIKTPLLSVDATLPIEQQTDIIMKKILDI